MSAHTGSCFCGQAKLSYEGEPAMKALCHCDDCKKISGGAYSINIVVPDSGFKTTGTFKPISKTADTGNTITSHFCPECGTTLYRDGPSFPGLKIIKAGVMDDKNIINEVAKPQAELYAPLRVAWVPKTEGTEDKQGMS